MTEVLVVLAPVVVVATWIAFDVIMRSRRERRVVRCYSGSRPTRAVGTIERADGSREQCDLTMVRNGSTDVEFTPPVVLHKGDKVHVPGVVVLTIEREHVVDDDKETQP